MKKSPLRILTIVTLIVLGPIGCGQRGPLYLPEPPAPLPKPLGHEKAQQPQT